MALAQNTTLCYLERDGAWLMLHRTKKKNDCNHDKWIGVGGKFEPCESPEECLLREVREETGVILTRWRYRGIITFVLDGVGEYMHLFTADQWQGRAGRGRQRRGRTGVGAPQPGARAAHLGGGQALFPSAGGGAALFLPQAVLPGGYPCGSRSGWAQAVNTNECPAVWRGAFLLPPRLGNAN